MIREKPLRPTGKLLIVTANFALFLLYVVTLWTVTHEPGRELRLALPILLLALGFAVFAPLALGIARRPGTSGRRRS